MTKNFKIWLAGPLPLIFERHFCRFSLLKVGMTEKQVHKITPLHGSNYYSTVPVTVTLNLSLRECGIGPPVEIMMKFIRHKGSASTIQSIHILENKIPETKKITKKKEKNTVKNTQQNNFNQQYCINKTISNIAVDIIWSIR